MGKYANKRIAGVYFFDLKVSLQYHFSPELELLHLQIFTFAHFHIEIAFTLFIICTPCTRAAPPLIAAATCTASIICASLYPFS